MASLAVVVGVFIGTLLSSGRCRVVGERDDRKVYCIDPVVAQSQVGFAQFVIGAVVVIAGAATSLKTWTDRAEIEKQKTVESLRQTNAAGPPAKEPPA